MKSTNNKRPLTVRGRTFVGTVTKAKAQQTATVTWESRTYNSKYERYERSMSKVQVHNPEEISAQHGDKVRIAECRPISKTKKFIIVEKLGQDREMLEKEQAADHIERGKKKVEEKTEAEEQTE